MKILISVDGSAISTRATRYVLKHWNGFGVDTLITLVNVDLPLRASVSRHLSAADVADFHRDNADADLRSARRILKAAGCPFDEKRAVGDPADEIINLARRGKFDMVVMGSHGRGVLKSLFLGSVVVKVLASSTVPVLVVR